MRLKKFFKLKKIKTPRAAAPAWERHRTMLFFSLGIAPVLRGEWEREHEGGLIRCAGRTTGVVIRRRAASGETARGVVFFEEGGAVAVCSEDGCGSRRWTRSVHTLRIAGGPAIRGI